VSIIEEEAALPRSPVHDRIDACPRGLIRPHGGRLMQLIVEGPEAAAIHEASRMWPSWDLTPRQLCDLELLLSGGFSPLTGFMCSADYESVCSSMRLADGTLWPMPVTLDVTEQLAEQIAPGDTIALRDSEGVMLAVLDVEDIWQPDREAEAKAVFATTSRHHPGVAHLLDRTHAWYVGGTLRGLQMPVYYDFRGLRATPAELRAEFAELGWDRVVAFQTRNPMHRAHYELTYRAALETGAQLLVHPVVGATKPGDIDHYTRVRCYEALLSRYPEGTAKLALLPLAMRMGGPREAVLHAIIRKNHGCTHLIVGRDHASPGKDADGTPFYGPFEPQELLASLAEEVGVEVVNFPAFVYAPKLDQYIPTTQVTPDLETRDVSGTRLREMLATGEEIPSWFTFPEVAEELRRRHPSRREQGLAIFFTGLSGSGKSTIAKILLSKMLEAGSSRVSLLDGDEIRKHLSSELGFSKEHRDLNIRRIGYVASEIAKAGGIAICAPIAPYDRTRKDVRAMIEAHGGFVLVHIATPLEECERRDRKGHYAKARAGIIKEFTGISDPYEAPDDAEFMVDTTGRTPESIVDDLLAYLQAAGYPVVG
jgi:sulfate adenylyltransferase